MENLDLLSNDLQITPRSQTYLVEAARWGKFLAIMGFILCGLMVLLAFFIPAVLSQMPQTNGLSIEFTGAMKTGMTILYLVFSVLFFMPCLFLYKFSIKMQSATKLMSQENLDESLMNLKSLFKFYGIFTIAILSFYALVFIIGIIVAAMR